MDLPLLVGLIIVGVGLVALVLHLTGAGTALVLEHPDDVIAALVADHPHALDGHVMLSDDGRCGFVILDEARTGIVRVMGRHLATRIVNREEISRVERTGATVHITFRDFGWSKLEAVMPSVEDAKRLTDQIDPVSFGR